MKLLYQLSYVSTILFICMSCAREAFLDDGDNIVVVECILSCDSIQKLSLSLTRSKANNSGNMDISEAKAVLYDETSGKEAGTFVYIDGEWTLSYSAVPEHEYRLDIDVIGYDHISARQKMPKQVKVGDSFEGYKPQSSPLQNTYHGYEKYGAGYFGSVYYCANIPENTWICAVQYDKQSGTTSLVEDICSDYPYIDNFNLTGRTFEPLIRNREGIREGSFESRCYYLKGYPLHRRYIRTSQTFTNSESNNHSDYMFIIYGAFADSKDTLIEEPLGDKGGILFTAVSEDYNHYLEDAMYYQQLQETSDLSSIYIRDNIFSNIEGGIGIFGAKTDCFAKWVIKGDSSVDKNKNLITVNYDHSFQY